MATDNEILKIVIDEKQLHKAYRQFNTLVSAKAQGRVMSAARAAGARVIATAARKTSAFKNRTGRLRASIRATKVKPYWKGYYQIRAGGEYKGGLAPHAYNVEHGHRGLRGNRGAKPNPFLKPAAKSKAHEAFKKSGLAFWKGVQRELKKGN